MSERASIEGMTINLEGQLVKEVPPCTCGYTGEKLHTDDCKRLIGLVRMYEPPGLRLEDGRVVRDP